MRLRDAVRSIGRTTGQSGRIDPRHPSALEELTRRVRAATGNDHLTVEYDCSPLLTSHDHDGMLAHLRDEWGTLGVLMALLEPLSPPAQDAVLAAAVVKLKPQDSRRPLPS